MTDVRTTVGQLESWLDEVRTLHGELLLAPATDGGAIFPHYFQYAILTHFPLEKSRQLRAVVEDFRATSLVAREKIKSWSLIFNVHRFIRHCGSSGEQ